MVYKSFFKWQIAVVIILLLFGCSRKADIQGQKGQKRAMKTIQKRIRTHGDVFYFTDGYKEHSAESVPRVVLDTLELESINNVNDFVSQVDSMYPDHSEYVLINYYPGKDASNSTGGLTRNSIGMRNLQLKKKIHSTPNIILLNVYKNNTGLERWDKHLEWIKDEGWVITNTFFKHHYPSSSYAILHKSGRYYAYYGEHMFEQKLEDIDLFMKIEDHQ